MRKSYFFLRVLFLSFSAFLVLGTQTTKAQHVDSLTLLTDKLMTKYNVKGVGIVATSGDSIIYKKGFGRINNSTKFDESSYIYIASNTKAFTGLAIAKLVHQKRIGLNDPITEYIPANYFPDSLNISEITIRNLLTHTTGLSNDPMIFRTAYSGEHPRDIKKLLQFSYYINDKPDHSFKYSNYGYLLVGIIIESVTGMHWKKYLEKEILPELGMANTMAHIPSDSSNTVLPYSYKDKFTPIKSQKTNETLHAAGGLYSTLNDMGAFLMHYTQNSSRLPYVELSKESLIKLDSNMDPFKQTGYGYGWIHGGFNGEKLVFHFGSFPGYESFMAYMPEKNIAVFTFTNEAEGGPQLAAQLGTYFFNSYLNKPNTEQFNAQISSMVQASYKEDKSPLQVIYKPQNPAQITGTYTSDEYGTLTITESDNVLNFKLGQMNSLAYQGEKDNEILVEWTPGIIEHLYVRESHKGSIQIKYGEFDTFNPLKN